MEPIVNITIEKKVELDYLLYANAINFYLHLMKDMDESEDEPEEYASVYDAFMDNREALKTLIKEKL